MNEALHLIPVAELGRYLRNGSLSALQLTEYFLDRITRFNPQLHAFIHCDPVLAIDTAIQADRELASGHDRGPLHGIPYALKDIFDVADTITTCNSHLRLNHVAQTSAFVQQRLVDGGAINLGKLATHEFALGGPGFDLPFPPARNPWNLAHFTGASSSGAGAAIAAGLCPIALGSDTSGSIRGPACLCGVVGFKPTYGLVSRAGVYPLSWSLDHCGPLTRFVEDAALAMEVIAGHDARDPTTVQQHFDFVSEESDELTGIRIAWPRHLLTDSPYTDSDLVELMDRHVAVLQSRGAIVEEITFEHYELFNACGRVLMSAESFAIHEDMLKNRANYYGRFTYQRIIAGAAISAAELIEAQQIRAQLTGWMNTQIFPEYTLLLFPSSLRAAALFTEFGPDWPPAAHVVPSRTIPFNVSGNPAINLPIGLSSGGLPLGIQLVAALFDDRKLLNFAQQFETQVLMPPPEEIHFSKTH
ncbi:amidase [Pectobacterium polaris]|uniref:amidase n=1 Tax=Pectobacterium polaris TaxID=2042057 RepID=UPI0023AF7E09|nr:amidase [Pectobacterium polaris]MDE8755252.1 amidase [Pectobacterium polaris]